MISNHALVLQPSVATSSDQTHSALVVSDQSISDVQFSADFITLAQLRTGSPPNPWETAWAVFDYTDPDHFYYVAFKTNGWEIGKRDPSYPGGQRFLATGDYASPVGTQHHFDISQSGATFTVTLDGQSLATITDLETPYTSGKIGFYTEDAKVAFDNVTGSITEDFESLPLQTFSDGATFGQWTAPFVGYGEGDIAVLSGDQPQTVVGTSGSDTLWGGTANDIITGALGADTITGGGGADTFVYASTKDSTRTAHDLITDWITGDKIDVHQIDAITKTTKLNHFTFVGTNPITGAGQLAYGYDASQNLTYVEGRVDGNPAHDLYITLAGHVALSAADFIL
ncbi:M10 family metallopeptidase C-terminal domain-containing protein [Methylobacterium nodulans]|uniref:Hemolysin-type calcium-binding region n=1 Tax=Methylobacterium nodulans (strain LMG 21967 / CNCM I-2342 / ORS 2060) TaxID=460265 RepID=B8ICV7_METNO|nr:M10 family metallopeptidase C-terminal domain-containing protein [Methylobacterium nodulans]ACL57518.1 Hemolysin-type calcium-binding region [Methylobacterium nodulans ORS 2060]